ncbi:MAG TPA: hypothetical protein VMS64_26575 [Candidatus Methylomirabilis sp.]|nr:hypothetical protein [Candidatus Methylomirabilis sp.]
MGRIGYTGGVNVAFPERSSGLVARLLLAFVLALLTLHAGQPSHVHKGTTPGAYNEEHVLASLESTTGDVPLPDQVASVFISLDARSSVPILNHGTSSSVPRPADSRAPPLA